MTQKNKSHIEWLQTQGANAMIYNVHHYINGQHLEQQDNVDSQIINSATGELIASVPFAQEKQITAAITSAKTAFPVWANTPPLRRAKILFKFRDLLEEHIEELAVIVTQEHGKTLEDARGSILRGIELVEFACGIPNQLKGSFSENVGTNIDSYTIRQPLGICVGVSPFNFPVMVPLWLMIPAIACGNCFILKPSEKDPSASVRIAELLTEAGLPAGVVNVVHGGKETVDLLIKHPEVQAVSAVASSAVAEYIYQTAIKHNKRSHTFGGAKNHCVVMPDVDIEEVAKAIVGAAFGSAGERCMALSVVIAVTDKVADALVSVFKSLTSKIEIGPGTDLKVEVGPLISAEHLAHVKSYIATGLKEGAKLVIDNRDIKISGYEKGYYLGPCVFDHVTQNMKIYQEEIFGPVLSIVRVADFETALELTNKHPYGNGTAIFTHDGEVARTFASRVQVGMVGINVPIPVPVAYHSFGGWKHSFFGDIALHGDQGVQFYTKLKTVTTRWPKGIRSNVAFEMPS